MSPLMIAYFERSRKRERRTRRLLEAFEVAVLGAVFMGAVALLIWVGSLLEAVI